MFQPVSGEQIQTAFRLPRELVEDLDKLVEYINAVRPWPKITRSELVRQVLARAIAERPAWLVGGMDPQEVLSNPLAAFLVDAAMQQAKAEHAPRGILVGHVLASEFLRPGQHMKLEVKLKPGYGYTGIALGESVAVELAMAPPAPPIPLVADAGDGSAVFGRLGDAWHNPTSLVAPAIFRVRADRLPGVVAAALYETPKGPPIKIGR